LNPKTRNPDIRISGFLVFGFKTPFQ